MRPPSSCSRPLRLWLLGVVGGVLATVALHVVRNSGDFTLPATVLLRAAAAGGRLPTLVSSTSSHTNQIRTSTESIKPKKGLLLVGIMTAQKYVDSRAWNVWRTWAQHIPGKVLFFVAEDTTSEHPELPLIRLRGVDDVYPPQKKSFAMLRWMYDNYGNEFDWFVRADDDLYVRAERLETFLRSLDPQKVHLLGQAGLGNTAEYGQLSLGPDANYCMGGPGVVLSRETLALVAPHLESCLGSLMTTHEDVELGRCIKRHLGVSCTWNYEMTTLFHNNQTRPDAYAGGGVDELRKAITLHPVKSPRLMRALHVEAETIRLADLRARRIRLQRELDGRLASLTRRVANTTTDLQTFDFIALNKITFCANMVTCPRHTIDINARTAINDIVTQLFHEFNQNARQRGRFLQFQNIQYGYSRVEPRHGVDYILDVILLFKKFRPPHRATLSVRRHAYVQQTFAAPEAIGESAYRRAARRRAAFELVSATSTSAGGVGASPIQEPTVTTTSNHVANAPLEQIVYVLVPLRGRASTFARFATNLRSILSAADRKRVEVHVICYASDDADEDAEIQRTIDDLSAIVTTRRLQMEDAEFNRGRALTAGAATLPEDALMFFTDVDMQLSREALDRIRLNTIIGAQVYFPIVFSEFSAKFWSAADRSDSAHTHFSYGRQRGYFRHFGYGLVSLYRRDFEHIGGFNLSIQGWGMEDVDLFEKCVASPHLRVFRAPDPGLVHVFHAIKCPTNIPSAQRNMCIGSKAASMASLDVLAEQFSQYA